MLLVTYEMLAAYLYTVALSRQEMHTGGSVKFVTNPYMITLTHFFLTCLLIILPTHYDLSLVLYISTLVVTVKLFFYNTPYRLIVKYAPIIYSNYIDLKRVRGIELNLRAKIAGMYRVKLNCGR